jgi:pimeloyl-ACP methyl ester carboxylesterase
MATYVLVHGSWTGSWIWKNLAAKLRAAGHLVYHPSLDGCAERKGAMRPGITLDTHGQEIADLMFYDDLKDVILVGIGGGGIVMARAAEIVPDRVRRLIFVDGLMCRPGETAPIVNSNPATASLDGITRPVVSRQFADVDDPAVQEWVAARYTPHPRSPTEDPVDLTDFWSRKWQVDVLRCTHGNIPPEAHQKRTAELLGGTYTELDASHLPWLTHVDELATYLLARA